MATSSISQAYDALLAFLVEKATPQEILAFELPEATRQRALDLLDRQDDDTLTPAEAAELDQMRYVDNLISALKARALAQFQG